MAVLLDIANESPDNWLPFFKAALPEQEIIWRTDRPAKLQDPDAIEWAVVWSPERETLKRLSGLKAIFSMGAGVDHITRIDALPPDVPIVRFVDSDLTNRMSEWIVLQCLIHLRQQRRYDAQQEKCLWNPLAQPTASQVSVGILGLGVLGKDAARKLAILGFGIAGWSRTAKSVENVACYSGKEGLEEFLARTDILVSLLPHTQQTEGFIDRSVFGKLRRAGALAGPFFVNAGRGKTHKEDDLIAALKDGTLKGASLDVFETEPLPRDSALWNMKNVVVTPHVAAWSSPKAVAEHVARQIARYVKGLPFECVVDRSAGY